MVVDFVVGALWKGKKTFEGVRGGGAAQLSHIATEAHKSNPGLPTIMAVTEMGGEASTTVNLASRTVV